MGAPVTATDTDNDTLTYELDDDAVFGNDLATLTAMLQFFDIDMETGQIAVAQELDYDSDQDQGTAGNRRRWLETYTVIARATDPSGLADNITLTITAGNANEDPGSDRTGGAQRR